MIKPPCLGCTSRSAICHAHCEKYTAYLEQIDKAKQEKYRYGEILAFQVHRYWSRHKKYAKG